MPDPTLRPAALEDASAPPRVVLVGAGVVGRAILRAHVDCGLSVTLADQDQAAIGRAVEALADATSDWTIREMAIGETLAAAQLVPPSADASATPARETPPSIVIESIVERLDAKQSLFRQAERWFGPHALLCSNTSTIPIGSIGAALQRPQRFCGLHFFMPVDRRPAVEVIRGAATDEATIRAVELHARRLRKEPLLVADAPGFVVNRMLAPYLNQAMRLLCAGISAERIEAAALQFGMPMSPLELIDWIGTRTAFDAGRVYWQAFPGRIDPSPLIAAMVKRGRAGRGSASGFYDYHAGERSASLSDVTRELVTRYHRELAELTDEQLKLWLAIPMWIEGALILRERIVERPSELETAMAGGLGFEPRGGWLDFYDRLGLAPIVEAIERWSPSSPAMRIDDALRQQLTGCERPSEALRFAASTDDPAQ